MSINAILKALALAIVLGLLTAPGVALAQGGEKEEPAGTMNKIFGPGAKDKKEAQPKQSPQPQDAAAEPQQQQQQTSAPTQGQPGRPAATTTPSSSGSDIPPEIMAGRREQMSEEEAAIVPYYNNFLKDYRLGPEDVISVEVFNQPRYSKTGITVPPDGRISFYLIPEGVRVVGKTTQQVQEEIQKKLDEYIIDPQVTVYLDKAMSARYAVLGDVGKPGVMIMTRRVSILEAIAEAGGILNTGDKKKVVILRRKPDGTLYPKLVNMAAIEKGQAKEMDYLAPGDQVVVPGNRLKSIQQLLSFVPMLSFGRIFGLPF